MTDQKQSQAYYDDFSNAYDNPRGEGYHRLIDDLEMDVMLPLCSGKRVLEVGCGTGLILSRIAKYATDAVGVDLSKGMIKSAHKQGLSVAVGSATQLPFPDNTFDLVCSFKVLAHVPDIRTALAEITRVTKPGGQMALEFYNPWSVRYIAKRLAGPQPISDGRTEADVYTRWDSPLELPKLFPAGVQIEGLRGVRVFTPAAFVHRIPVLRDVLSIAERRAVDSPLRYFGGFMIVLARK